MQFRTAKIAAIGLLLFVLLTHSSRADLAITALWPANNATNVCGDTPLRLTFNEPPVLGGKGRIAVFRDSDHKLLDTLDLGAPGFTNDVGGRLLRYQPIRVADREVSIQLHSHALGPQETCSVSVDAGVFQSADGHDFAGLTNGSAWRFTTRAAPPRGRTNLVVAADGTGDFCTPQGAVDNVPDDNQTPVEIFARKGVYEGIVYVMGDKGHVHFTGEDRQGTVITGINNDRLNPGRIGRGLLNVDADDFVLQNLTVSNATPYRGSQAEALRVKGDRCVLRDADFASFQDTLLLSGRVYATNCFIQGDVDFIWGAGAVFFDQCEIKALHNGYYLQARNSVDVPGYIFNRCKLTATPEAKQCWLARIDTTRFPGVQVAFIECQMCPQVPPAGWEARGPDLTRLRFEEFHSTDAQGNPLDVSRRHSASRQLSAAEAAELSDPARVMSFRGAWDPRRQAAGEAR